MSVGHSSTELEDHARQLVTAYFSDDAFRTSAAPLLEHLPVWCPVLDLGPMWLVSGYDEITSLLSRDCLRTFPEVGGTRLPLASSPALAEWFELSLPMRDGDDHRRLRALIQPSFTRRGVDDLEVLVARCIDRRLDDALQRGHMDGVADFAVPLPMDLSFELLGIPEDDRRTVAEWVSKAKSAFLLDDACDASGLDSDVDSLAAYIASSLARADADGTSLLAVLARASRAGLLSSEELRAYVFLLLVNGLDTLTAAVVDAVYQLLQPDARSSEPMARDEATAYFEEILRYYSPVRLSARVLTDATELSGRCLDEGSVVSLFFAAANRDPRHFDRPGTFDPARPRGRHLAFGHGVHQCLGRHLANLAGAIVLERLSSLGHRIELAVGPEELDWSSSLLYNTLEALPLAIST